MARTVAIHGAETVWCGAAEHIHSGRRRQFHAQDVEGRHSVDDGTGARGAGPGLLSASPKTRSHMTERLKRGDRVEWNFRGRIVAGRVRRRLTARTEIGGQVVAASKDDPRYVVRSDRSGKETTRRPEALRRLPPG